MRVQTSMMESEWRTIPVEAELVQLTLGSEALTLFLPLLQEGVWVRCGLGGSVKELLCHELCIDPDYVTSRISTLFLNGQPVDDLDVAKVREGDVLALSAAMPGLVGAVMRRGGYFAGLRNSITCRPTSLPDATGQGFIKLKLFNRIMLELGPGLLETGTYLKKSELLRFLPSDRGQLDRYEPACLSAGKSISLDDLLNQAPDRWLFWKIVFRT